MNDKVSVIMPAYNSEQFIEESISSVLNQTYDNIELIIVNDYSSDDTKKIIEKHRKIDKRVVLIDNTTNIGVAKSRNRAIELASGKYLAFLDSDDIWMVNKLDLQINSIKNERAAFVFSSYNKIDENGKEMKSKVKVEGRYNYKKLLKANYIGILTAIYDCHNIGKVYFNDEYEVEDYLYWLDLLKLTEFGYGINEVTAMYRVRTGSRSSNRFALIKNDFIIYRKAEKLSIVMSLYLLTTHIISKVFLDK